MADVHFVSGEISETITRLEQAKAVNPISEETLGRLAACHFVAHKKSEFDSLCAEVTARDPKPGRFWLALAERLDDRRLFDDARGYFRQTIDSWPHLGEAKTLQSHKAACEVSRYRSG